MDDSCSGFLSATGLRRRTDGSSRPGTHHRGVTPRLISEHLHALAPELVLVAGRHRDPGLWHPRRSGPTQDAARYGLRPGVDHLGGSPLAETLADSQGPLAIPLDLVEVSFRRRPVQR